jgi:hypothetical protein
MRFSSLSLVERIDFSLVEKWLVGNRTLNTDHFRKTGKIGGNIEKQCGMESMVSRPWDFLRILEEFGCKCVGSNHSHSLRGRYSTPLFESGLLYGLVSVDFPASGRESCPGPTFRSP